jgi:glycosyltransferase involved in cell wall biosynthesis
MERWVRQYATEGLACSASAAEVLFGADWQSDPRIHVLHSGIDLEPFRQAGSREAVRQELGIPPDVPVVGHVGRVAKQKNHDFLLQIAVEFLKLEPQARFLVVGDGPERVRIESMAHEMGLRGKVIFAGGRSDVPRLMLGAMDVFVLPSLWEGLARVLIEAQASGLRCVTTNTVPTEAAVVPGALELVSLAAGPHEWAARVHGALMRGRLAQAEALQALAQSDFTIEKTVAALKRLYDQARLITRTA